MAAFNKFEDPDKSRYELQRLSKAEKRARRDAEKEAKRQRNSEITERSEELVRKFSELPEGFEQWQPMIGTSFTENLKSLLIKVDGVNSRMLSNISVYKDPSNKYLLVRFGVLDIVFAASDIEGKKLNVMYPEEFLGLENNGLSDLEM